MIHYQLRCGASHEFDGWFQNSGAFEAQAVAGLVACPVCADMEVTRALMAPSIARKGRMITASPTPAAAAPEILPPAPAGPLTAGVMPDAVRAALQKLRQEVETHCDYVGPDFAEEARRIHHEEAPARAIYGEATPEEVESLVEDGIGVARLPWVQRQDS